MQNVVGMDIQPASSSAAVNASLDAAAAETKLITKKVLQSSLSYCSSETYIELMHEAMLS